MDEPLDRLVARYRAGDEAAARALFDRFAGRMLLRVRETLSGASNRAALDSEGIVQEGFRSFFSAIGKAEFDPARWSIGGLLATIVLRKAYTRLRRQAPEALSPENLEGIVGATASLTAELSPTEAEAVMQEAVAAVLESSTAREKSILKLFLDPRQECSAGEIARELHLARSTVADVIDRFMARLRYLSS